VDFRFEFRPYRRLFKQPLQTRYGKWSVREGIILRLTDANEQIGWGEIAPIAHFGTESFAQALSFCQFLSTEISANTIAHIPPTFPACQFGFGAAQEMLMTSPPTNALQPPVHASHWTHLQSYLLPTGLGALVAWQDPWKQGIRTFKWKIGVAALAEELNQFKQLIQILPSGTRLRLDANGGLSFEEAYQWLQLCDRLMEHSMEHSMEHPPVQAEIEFLEQPLPVNQLDQLLHLQTQFKTPIALDESVSTLAQLQTCYEKGWRGVFVIKAAIAGFPDHLRAFCQTHPIDIVWSSALETSIAQHFIYQSLIPSLPPSNRALGFGVNHWFLDTALNQLEFESLWESL
jgi:O-succinylbenzoate synthase